MHLSEPVVANGRRPPSVVLDARTELAELRAMCKRQALVIDAPSDAVTTFRSRVQALTAENAELRIEAERLCDGETSDGQRRTEPEAGAWP